MHSLTGGRFTLGIGRGVDRLWDAMGLPHITTAQMEDFAGLMRRLWAGEVILGHDGPAGSWPYLNLDGVEGLDIPLGLVAFGPNSLKLGGRAFDQIVLHTFFTDETTARVVKTVKDAAEQAGRDPDAVKVWSCFATVGDHIAPDLQLKKTVGRLATYLQGYGDLLVRTNNWDPAVLERFRADEFVSNFQGAIDGTATTEELEHVATLIPDEWLEPMAKGTPEQCVAAVRNQFDLGCDGVIMHGATPDRARAGDEGVRGEPLRMARLVFASITSLDLYVNDAHGDFEWAAPDAEVHGYVNDLERPIGTYLYGRRLYEMMAVWETWDTSAEPPEVRDYAQQWRETDKVVYSSSLPEVTTSRTRLERTFDPDAVRTLVRGRRPRRLHRRPDPRRSTRSPPVWSTTSTSSSTRSSSAAGRRALADGVSLDLELVDEHRFGNGVVYLHHRVRR